LCSAPWMPGCALAGTGPDDMRGCCKLTEPPCIAANKGGPDTVNRRFDGLPLRLLENGGRHERSGWMPCLSISDPPGVRYLATVTKSADPSCGPQQRLQMISDKERDGRAIALPIQRQTGEHCSPLRHIVLSQIWLRSCTPSHTCSSNTDCIRPLPYVSPSPITRAR
jgi:hypothetical protein